MFDWSVITRFDYLIWSGLLITLEYTVITSAIGLAIGLVVAIFQLSNVWILRVVGLVFVEFFRNVPLLVWLLWTYYALPIFLDLAIDRQSAGILALSLYVGSYYAEIFRAGIQSIDRGQTDAARALALRLRAGLAVSTCRTGA